MAKSSKQTITLEVGARVAASLPSLSDQPLIGTIEAVSGKGWYRVKLDVALDAVGVKDGCVSALARSLTAHTAPADGVEEAAEDNIDGEEFFQSNRDADLPHEPDAEGEEAATEGDPEEAEATVAAKMAEALKKAREHYVKCKRPNGAATAHNGDGIAKALRDYEPLEVAALADKCLGEPVGTHEAKYGHLNNGQIRMNSGNRIRATFAKALKERDAETITRISKVLDLDGSEEQDEEQDEEQGE